MGSFKVSTGEPSTQLGESVNVHSGKCLGSPREAQPPTPTKTVGELFPKLETGTLEQGQEWSFHYLPLLSFK